MRIMHFRLAVIIAAGATPWVAANQVPAPAADDHPIQRDRTGVRWAFPFQKAQGEAKQRNRLLMVKPVAFGTTKSGCW